MYNNVSWYFCKWTILFTETMDSKITIHAETRKKMIDLNWSNVAITTTVSWKVGKYKYLHSQNGRFWKRKIGETGKAFLRRRISSLQDRTRAKRYMALTDFTCPSSRYLFWQHMQRVYEQNDGTKLFSNCFENSLVYHWEILQIQSLIFFFFHTGHL